MSRTPVGAHSCVTNPRLKDAQTDLGLSGGRYGRMFPGLPPCEVDVESAVGLGRAASRVDATLPVLDGALENPRIPAGFAALGQLVASLTHALIDLPEQIVGRTEMPEHHSLASRDLQWVAALGLPSGEAVARMMGVEPLTADECDLGPDWTAETPLWYYAFKEAEARAAGEHLGFVGGRIVVEVLLGLLDADPGSYRGAEPGGCPELPSSRPGRFIGADLVVFAGG